MYVRLELKWKFKVIFDIKTFHLIQKSMDYIPLLQKLYLKRHQKVRSMDYNSAEVLVK